MSDPHFNVYRKAVERSISRILAAAAICTCAACGSNSGSSGQKLDTPRNLNLEALRQLNARGTSLIQSFQPSLFTALGDIPVDSHVSYSGYILLNLSDYTDEITDAISGEIVIDVAFDQADMVSGRTGVLLDENGRNLSGQLDLSGGRINRDGDPSTDATFQFEGRGELTDSNNTKIDIGVVFEGDFLTADATGIGGEVLGRASIGESIQTVGGVFIVEVLD